ncbi:CDP-glucose 4,6-dehydratase [bacterium]|nr:CDP-glucose 4,6-dehydratase [bacterium]MBU1753536.1 CDP-glucose 4,6-dehydratase [bacterium]
MDGLFHGIFKEKKVLVTGHTGFKGAWLSLWLKELGAKVIGYSLPPPTDPSLFETTKLDEHITSIMGNILDYEHFLSVLEEYQPEIVFHLAAQPLVRVSYEDSRLTYETNVMGTINILEALRRGSTSGRCNSVRAGIIITSDKCYENKEWEYAYRENDPLGGYDPYSSSKACTEIVTAAYRNSFFNPEKYNEHKVSIASVRAGNVIGGGDWGIDRIVPDIIRAMGAHKPVELRNPQAIRPWQYVLEPLSGYLHLASLMCQDAKKYGSAWNFGPEHQGHVTVQQLVEKIIARWENGTWQLANNQIQPHEANYLSLDCTKSNNLLKWYPAYGLDETMDETVRWYQGYYKNSSEMYSFTRKQIFSYIEKAKKCDLIWT